MSTLSEREATLRRALQSAAASIEPAADGLERIQARLRRPRPIVVGWLEAAWTDFFLRARAALQTAGPLLADGMRSAWERFGPASEAGRGRPLRWLRPLAALSLAIFVVAAGTYVGLNSSALFPAGTSLNSGKVSPGASSTGGQGHQSPAGSASPFGASGLSGGSPSPSACAKTPKAGRYSPPPSSSSPSPSPSGTSTSTGSPTPTTTPTPSSSSTTPDPADTTSGTGADPGGAAGTDSAANAGQARAAVTSVGADPTGMATAKTATESSRRHRTAKHPKASTSANPCASKTTAALTSPASVLPGARGATSLASGQLTAARLGTTVAAARLNRNIAG